MMMMMMMMMMVPKTSSRLKDWGVRDLGEVHEPKASDYKMYLKAFETGALLVNRYHGKEFQVNKKKK